MATTVEAPVPAIGSVRAAWRRFARALGDVMPKGLYARSLIIIIAPVVLLQALVAFVFMQEHFRTVTARLSAAVVADICAQLATGHSPVMGVMIESNLVAGRQDIVPGQPLTYGQSVTDACIDWDTSARLLEDLAAAVRAGRRAKG